MRFLQAAWEQESRLLIATEDEKNGACVEKSGGTGL